MCNEAAFKVHKIPHTSRPTQHKQENCLQEWQLWLKNGCVAFQQPKRELLLLLDYQTTVYSRAYYINACLQVPYGTVFSLLQLGKSARGKRLAVWFST